MERGLSGEGNKMIDNEEEEDGVWVRVRLSVEAECRVARLKMERGKTRPYKTILEAVIRDTRREKQLFERSSRGTT